MTRRNLAWAMARVALIMLGMAGGTSLSAQALSGGGDRQAMDAARKNDRLAVRNAGRARIPSRLPTRIDTRLNTRLDERYHVDTGILKPLERSKVAIEAATTLHQ